MKKWIGNIFVIVSLLALFGCNEVLEEDSENDSGYGTLIINDKARYVATSDIQKAVVKVEALENGQKVLLARADSVAADGSGVGSATIERIKIGKNRVITVQAFKNATEEIPGEILYAVKNINAGNNFVQINQSSSPKGKVYLALLNKGVDVGADDFDATKISVALPQGIRAEFVNAEAIANDYVSDTLKSSASYTLQSGTVVFNLSSVEAGTKIYISDPASKYYEVQTGDNSVSITNVASGTWTVYKSDGQTIQNMGSVTIGKNGGRIVSDIDFSATSSGTGGGSGGTGGSGGGSGSGSGDEEDDVPQLTPLPSGLTIFVKNTSPNPTIWAWEIGGQNKTCSVSMGYTWNTQPAMTSASGYMNDATDWWMFNIPPDKVSGGVIHFKVNQQPSADSGITGKNVTFWYDGTSCVTSDPTTPKVPTKPKITITPENGDISLTGTISVKIDTGNANRTSATVTLSGAITRTYTYLDFVHNSLNIRLKDCGLQENQTINITASATNSKGTDTKTCSWTTVNNVIAGGIVSDPNELRIYQVMVASFQDGDPSIGYSDMWGPTGTKGGDLQGVINALDYIKELGCNAVWMTPIFDSAGVEQKLAATGYFATDYFNVDPKFGTNAKFNELVEAAHSKNISIILDGVFGHNGGSSGGQMKASPQRNGILNPGIRPSTSNPVNYATDQNTLKYYSDVARYWITEYKIDGWRLDQCYQVAFGENAKGNTTDNCNTGGHNYWYDIRKVVDVASSSNGAKGTNWGTLGYMVGEHWRGDASTIQNGTVTPGNSRGFGLQSCFDFPAYYKLVQGFACEHGGKSTGNIGDALSYTYSTFTQKGYSCKEDDNSYKTYYPNVMLSNHDLYRIGQLIKEKHGCSYGSDDYVKRNAVLIAAQCAYTGPITIYYGDEIGDTSEGKGGNSDNLARTSGKITGFSTWEQRLHDMTQKCLQARAEHKALWSGSNETVISNANFYVAKKQCDGETIYIAFNNGTTSQSFTMQGSGTDLLSNENVSGTVSVPALTARYVLVK